MPYVPSRSFANAASPCGCSKMPPAFVGLCARPRAVILTTCLIVESQQSRVSSWQLAEDERSRARRLESVGTRDGTGSGARHQGCRRPDKSGGERRECLKGTRGKQTADRWRGGRP